MDEAGVCKQAADLILFLLFTLKVNHDLLRLIV